MSDTVDGLFPFMILLFIVLLVITARKIVKYDAQKRPDSGSNII